MAGALDHSRELLGADHEHARRTEPARDHLADDLEGRERVLGDRDADGVEAAADVVTRLARVVGQEREPAAGAVERRERLPRGGVQRAAVPDAAVEVEDEAPDAGERARGHACYRSPDERLNSAIASA